ncbi:hypothetical protein CXB51_004702 [Gossypium anomalum]|uniref:Fe2OG dioxygenase domain-containing protein n=1 Tax=Gossypium anomalum TaxID=47600 RepID=A0A8J6DC15_9ROSI|nr:hypothetical protein CXB51_004702 [Gossypium anomalum]
MEVERVQAIVSSSLAKDNIPLEFVRPEDEQPAITTFHGPIPDIPVIDINHPDQDHIIHLVANASRDWGIFQVVNHGIPFDLIQNCNKLERSSLISLRKRKKCMLSLLVHSPLKAMEARSGKMLMEKKNWADHLFHKIWPASCINHQAVNEEYAQEVRKVVVKLFKWLSTGLGLEADVLKQGVGDKLLSAMSTPALTLGVTSHTDLSAMTVLVPNEVPGLQVFKDGHWIDAQYIPGALIIHIGDQIEILSNGKYKAVLHRTTVDKEKTRMSWPVFLEPPGEFVVGPLPQLVDPQIPPKYKPKKFKDYSYCKFHKLPQY